MRNLLYRIELWPRWVVVAIIVFVGAAAVGAGLALAGRSPAPKAALPVASAARITPSPPPSSSPSSSPSPGPHEGESSVAGLTCRIAVSAGQSGSGGFVSFPGGAFQPDPASAVSGSGYGPGLSFDRAVGRWVPVSRNLVTPDGLRYAHWEWQAGVILTDVRSEARTVLGPGPQAASAARINSGLQLLEAAEPGIYAVATSPSGGVAPGLWLIPYSGGLRQVTATGFWHAIGGGAAWGTATPSVPEGGTDTIERLDLATGSVGRWFSVEGASSRVIGFDGNDQPVVKATSRGRVSVWLTAGPDSKRQVLVMSPRSPGPQGNYGNFGPANAVGDSHGVWVGSSEGLYFSDGTHQLTKVSTVSGPLGGGCA